MILTLRVSQSRLNLIMTNILFPETQQHRLTLAFFIAWEGGGLVYVATERSYSVPVSDRRVVYYLMVIILDGAGQRWSLNRNGLRPEFGFLAGAGAGFESTF